MSPAGKAKARASAKATVRSRKAGSKASKRSPTARVDVASSSTLVLGKPSLGSGSATEKELNLLRSTTTALGVVWAAAEKELKKLYPQATLRATTHVDDEGCATGHLALAINLTTQESCC